MIVKRLLTSLGLFYVCAALLLLGMLQGCATFRPVPNQPLNQ